MKNLKSYARDGNLSTANPTRNRNLKKSRWSGTFWGRNPVSDLLTGVLQRLAKEDCLKHVDYLSTVSGGGYIGGSLTWLLSDKAKKLKKDGICWNTSANLPYGVENPRERTTTQEQVQYSQTSAITRQIPHTWQRDHDNIANRRDSPRHPSQPFGVATAGGRSYGRAHVSSAG